MAFEWIHTIPEGGSSLDRMAVTGIECDFSGLVLRNHHDMEGDIEGVDRDIDIINGVEIRVEGIDRLHGLADKFQSNRDVVCVHGGDKVINRAAVKSRFVDVLCHPLRKGIDCFTYAMAETASENGVSIEVNLSRVTRTSGGERVEAIRRLDYLQELLRKYNTEFVISCDPMSHLDMNSYRDVAALSRMLGFREGEVEIGLRETPMKIIEGVPIDQE